MPRTKNEEKTIDIVVRCAQDELIDKIVRSVNEGKSYVDISIELAILYKDVLEIVEMAIKAGKFSIDIESSKELTKAEEVAELVLSNHSRIRIALELDLSIENVDKYIIIAINQGFLDKENAIKGAVTYEMVAYLRKNKYTYDEMTLLFNKTNKQLQDHYSHAKKVGLLNPYCKPTKEKLSELKKQYILLILSHLSENNKDCGLTADEAAFIFDTTRDNMKDFDGKCINGPKTINFKEDTPADDDLKSLQTIINMENRNEESTIKDYQNKSNFYAHDHSNDYLGDKRYLIAAYFWIQALLKFCKAPHNNENDKKNAIEIIKQIRILFNSRTKSTQLPVGSSPSTTKREIGNYSPRGDLLPGAATYNGTQRTRQQPDDTAPGSGSSPHRSIIDQKFIRFN